jgi:hypothetical protein
MQCNTHAEHCNKEVGLEQTCDNPEHLMQNPEQMLMVVQHKQKALQHTSQRPIQKNNPRIKAYLSGPFHPKSDKKVAFIATFPLSSPQSTS